MAIVFSILAGIFAGMFFMHWLGGDGGRMFGGHMMQRFSDFKDFRK